MEDLLKRLVPAVFLLCCFPFFLRAQTSQRQHGTIIRMRMADCLELQHGFMAAMSGAPRQQDPGQCPEYVLLSDKVVYVIVGKSSGMLIPLAETTQFRIQKNELLIRVDDENRETKFQLREMVLRSEWDHVHPNFMIEETEDAPPQKLQPAVIEQSSRTDRAALPDSR